MDILGETGCIRGANGVSVEWDSETGRYGFADVCRLTLRLRTRVPGVGQPLERTIERVGVHPEDVARVRSELLNGFLSGSIPYFFREDFPARYAERLADSKPRAARCGVS